MSGALLSLRSASCGYGQGEVLWDVSLDLQSGSAVAVIGRNGVGKTTLMRAIAGAIPLSRGTLTFDGLDVTALPPHKRARAGIGLVPQGRHIFPHLTVMENLETGLSARRDGLRKVPDHVFDLFPKLAQIRTRKGGLLSGGEQQQLAIGRALAGDPKLLLLDEPTEGIQPNVVQQIEDALRKVRDEMGMSVLIVEQYLDFVWRFADRYCAMQGGRIMRDGTVADECAADVAHYVNI